MDVDTIICRRMHEATIEARRFDPTLTDQQVIELILQTALRIFRKRYGGVIWEEERGQG